MKLFKILADILICFSAIAFTLVFLICCLLGEADIFGVAGIIRYSWVMLFFMLLPVLLIIISIILKIHNEKFMQYIVVGLIFIFLFGIFGSSRLFYKNMINFEESALITLEEKLAFELPKNMKTATITYENYTISYLKITDNDERIAFQNNINDNENWTDKTSTALCNSLPYEINSVICNDDYFMFYNLTTNEFNTYPIENGVYECIFIAYDKDINKLTILQNYKFTVI